MRLFIKFIFLFFYLAFSHFELIAKEFPLIGNWEAEKNIFDVKNGTVDGKNTVHFFIKEAGIYTLKIKIDENVRLYGAFNFHLFVPENISPNTEVIFHIKDVDFWWYQKLLPQKLIPGEWNFFSISFADSKEKIYDNYLNKYNWDSRGHFRPFDLSVLRKMRELGITVMIPDGEFTGKNKAGEEFIICDAILIQADEYDKELKITDIDFPVEVSMYEKFEVCFELSRHYSNPFDPEVIDVTAYFTTPSGKTFSYPCFYFQNYVRERDGEYEKLIPAGSPHWRLRISPLEQGEYSFYIKATDRKNCTETKSMKFYSNEPVSNGFIKVSAKDPLYFEYSDGSFFYPIGLNLHCTYDDRFHNVTMNKGHTEVRDHPNDTRTSKGGYIIDRRSYVHTDIFEKMARNGMNATEIWFASWGYEIEWRGDWKGYAGINHYNLENAYRLDLVMESAHKNNIYCNLVFHCHGQFAEGSERGEDGEFANHPYNRTNGGFLRNAVQIFYDGKAFDLLMKRMRYIVARYGYSRNIMSWEIISETDLTAARVSSASRNFVLKYAEKLKELDIHKHPVTNHYSGDYNITDNRLMRDPGMDFVTGDAYRGWGGRNSPFYFPAFYKIAKQTSEAWNKFNKPGWITECGCCWFGGPEYGLYNDVHQVCWATWMTHLAGTSLFWWFEYVDMKDLYWQDGAFAKFAAGEDKRGRNLRIASINMNVNGDDKDDLAVTFLTNENGGYVWIYDIAEFDYYTKTSNDKGIYFETRNYEAPEYRDIKVPVRGLLHGKYLIEYWDTYKGEIIKSETLQTTGTSITTQLPPFRKDIAIKIKPVE